jgi:HK97 gp10 family phage protein
MTIGIHFDGLSEWDAAVDEMIARAAAASREIVLKGTEIIDKNAAKRAPVKSGTLRRSIRRTKLAQFSATGYMAECGPTVKYGRRIELGFKGTDSLGRKYNQNGRPYFEPGVKDSEEELRDLYFSTYAEALRG